MPNDHKSAFVPIEAWVYSSPDIFSKRQSIDIGVLCEALIYYDKLYVNITNQEQFAQFVSWFYKYHNENKLLELLEGEIFNIYEYAFMSGPVLLPNGNYDIYNICDQLQLKPNSFAERYYEHPLIIKAVSDENFRKRLYDAMRGRVIEVKRNELGAFITENARQDYFDPERCTLAIQMLVDQIYRIRNLKAPEIKAKVIRNSDGTVDIDWDIDFVTLSRLAGDRFDINIATPLTANVVSNKFTWSASNLSCDLYLPEPMSMLVGNKLYEAAKEAKISNIIETLTEKVEFPNIRNLVNSEQIEFNDVMQFRHQSKQFRSWLQAEGERDRDAVIAYHNEVAEKSGLTKFAPGVLNMFGVVGGAALGTYLGSVEAAAATALGSTWVSNLASRLQTEWKPVVFGTWFQKEIAKILEKRK